MKLIVDTCVFIDSFDQSSQNHKTSVKLLERLNALGKIITMPAHAWFEVQCTLQRLANEKKFSGPMFNGNMQYPVELIHIDDKFINKYSMLNLPYIKGSDHIFIAVALKNQFTLITSDTKMSNVASQCGVKVFTPDEYLATL